MTNASLFILALGFVSGVFLESYAKMGFAFGALFLLLSGGIFLIGAKNDFASSRVNFSLFLLCFSFGVLRMGSAESNVFPLDHVLLERVTIEALITEEADVREDQTFLTVGEIKLLSTASLVGNEEEKIKTKILVKTSSLLSFNYGDKVEVTGVIKKPEVFETEGGGSFDYPSYLEKSGVLYILERAEVKVVSKRGGSFIKRTLFSLKGKFIEAVAVNIPEPQSSLLVGLVVGGKQSLGDEWLDRFQKSGVMHIVVLSGYNVTIVANSVIRFFSTVLSQTLGMVFGVISIIFFAIMTGGSATVVRATIMAVIVILAGYINRRYAVTRALIIAGVLMVLHNPAIVAFDPSFQLSFMATIALIYVSPLIEERLKFVTKKWNFREVVVSTISTQFFVLPLLLMMTGQFSIVALPVNILILGMIPVTMFFGFWAGAVGILSSTLALPFAYIAYGLLYYELKVVEIFSSLPFAAVSLPHVSPVAVVFIYLVIITVLLFKYKVPRFEFPHPSNHISKAGLN